MEIHELFNIFIVRQKSVWRIWVEFYVAKLFSRKVHICVFRVKIWLLSVGFLSPKCIMSNMILKHFCRREQIKFLSCCQEFESFTKYIIVCYYFHLNLALLVSVVYIWFYCDRKLPQFSEQAETLALLSAFCPSFVSLFFLPLFCIEDCRNQNIGTPKFTRRRLGWKKPWEVKQFQLWCWGVLNSFWSYSFLTSAGRNL